jgi:hypothetical protein
MAGNDDARTLFGWLDAHICRLRKLNLSWCLDSQFRQGRSSAKQRPSVGTRQGELRRDHGRHVKRLEAHALDQAVSECSRGLAEARLRNMGVGSVERVAGAPACIGHAQDPAE